MPLSIPLIRNLLSDVGRIAPFTWLRVKNCSSPRGRRSIAIRKVNDFMETKYYIVARIDGDYAWLNRTDAEEEPLFIARALLPEEIDEGTKLKYEMLQYEII